MSCTGWTNLKQFFGIIFGIPKNYLKFSDLKPPLGLHELKVILDTRALLTPQRGSHLEIIIKEQKFHKLCNLLTC